MTTPLPAKQPLDADSLLHIWPADLTDPQQWVCYRLEDNGKPKLDKVPVNPRTGRLAASNDPETWDKFTIAVAYHNNGGNTHGVGFVFSPADPFVGVDFDHCVDAATGAF